MSLPRPHTEQTAAPGLEIRNPESPTTNTIRQDHSCLTQPMPTLTDCNKISKKAEFGFSTGWPCWTSSRLLGRECGGHQCLQGMEGRWHPRVTAALVCPTPIATCPDRAHAASLCMDPAAGEIQGWVMMEDYQDLGPFVGFPAGVICV